MALPSKSVRMFRNARTLSTTSTWNPLGRAGVGHRPDDLTRLWRGRNICRRSISTNPVSFDDRKPYWQHIDLFKHATEDDFLSYRWQVSARTSTHARVAQACELIMCSNRKRSQSDGRKSLCNFSRALFQTDYQSQNIHSGPTLRLETTSFKMSKLACEWPQWQSA